MVANYYPISLCNVFYKIMSKAFVNRLKALLPSLTSKSQSPFVSGRQITDNILVAYEVVIFLKGKQMENRALCL